MSTANKRRRENSRSRNVTSPCRESSRPSKNDNVGENVGKERCSCWICLMKGKPIDVDRNWSIRFFGMSKEDHDKLMRLLDESVEDMPDSRPTDFVYLPTEPPPPTKIDATPSEFEKSTPDESGDDSSMEGADERDFVLMGYSGQSTMQSDEEASNQRQHSHFIPSVDTVSSPTRST